MRKCSLGKKNDKNRCRCGKDDLLEAGQAAEIFACRQVIYSQIRSCSRE